MREKCVPQKSSESGTILGPPRNSLCSKSNNWTSSSVDSALHGESSEELIDAVRHNILAKVSKNQDLYDPRDLDRVRENEWAVKRFLLDRKGNVEEATDMLNETLIW